MSINTLRIWIVEGGALVEYTRTGECSACGDCCQAKHVIRYQVQVGGDDKAELGALQDDYSEHEGWTCLWAQGIWWWWLVYDDDAEQQQACSVFDPQTRKCTLWLDDIEFPAICRYWPVHPKNIARFPRCTFAFERIAPQANESDSDEDPKPDPA